MPYILLCACATLEASVPVTCRIPQSHPKSISGKEPP